MASAHPLGDDEKTALFRRLPSALIDVLPKLRTAGSCVLSGIAAEQWPQKWPELMPGLVAMLRSGDALQVS